jgi:hypothetical protein
MSKNLFGQKISTVDSRNSGLEGTEFLDRYFESKMRITSSLGSKI